MKPLPDADPARWGRQLDQGLQALELDLDMSSRQRLLAYLALLHKWNRAYNLTAVRNPDEMVSRHLLDSLSILSWVRGPRVLDVGTGAGLPGIPLAIVCPDRDFVLLDSNGKKTRFVQHAVIDLGLDNVAVVQERVERLNDPAGFHTITSRAFADLHQMLRLTKHLRAPGGCWAAMKAGLEELEREPLPPGLVAEVIPLHVPGIEGRRHLVRVCEAS